MTPYQSLIADTIGTNDPAMLDLVEDIMRDGRTGLDGLTEVQFRRAAREAHADVILMAAAGDLDFYCDALGLAVPNHISC